MGTDIWFYVEKKYYKEDYEYIDGTWRKIEKSKKELDKNVIWISVDRWRVNPYYYLDPKHTLSKWKLAEPSEFYNEGRNYDLFNVLSNTRNDSNISYIALPKGLPSDISPELKEVALEDYDDFYDHSWLSLKELISYNWDEQYYCDQFMEYRSLRSTCSYFINKTIPKLLQLGDVEDVRIIFWYG